MNIVKGKTTSSVTENSSLPELVCVEFPGVGKNIDKMIESLGGMKKISEVYWGGNRRMECRFRSNDLFCKPLCGERHKSTNILIKVTCRRKKKKGKSIEEIPATYKIEPVGVVKTTFRFESLCDFQYLPMKVKEDKSLVNIYHELLPKGVLSSDWIDQPSPLFLPPATFSRMDTPQDYRFKSEPVSDNKAKPPQNVICRTRLKRSHFAIFHSFKDKDVPQAPLPGAISQIRYKFLDSKSFQVLKDEFEKRPIWSKNALMVRLKFTKDKLKYLLPTISFYFHTGPWRNLWVKFGFEPRTNPTAWLYQTFDFRIRQSGGAKTKVEAKRNYSNYVLPYKSVQHCKKKTSLVSSIHLGDEGEEEREGKLSKGVNAMTEEFYLFRPGIVPPYRQMFYQYCDIQVPEIQKLLESSILSDANQTCSEKYGWLPAGVENKCRDILSGLVEKTLAERSAKGETWQEEELMSNTEGEEFSDGTSEEEI